MSTKTSIFISYSRRDFSLVAAVVKLLRATREDVFQDIDDIRPGRIWRDKIEEAILAANLFIVFWCRHSAESVEVRKEIEMAISSGKVVTPILLDRTPLPRELSDYQCIDFQGISGLAHRTNLPLAAATLLGGVALVYMIVLGIGPEGSAVVTRGSETVDGTIRQTILIIISAALVGAGLTYKLIRKRRFASCLAEHVTKLIGPTGS